ncbi:unnamed protein product [Linum trigynum]|uniref:Reverse transcriptase domain-containing protein n=1 Tax=Linum trigynum TaxID=586398 RepID=A0AAV2FGD8_9ROSI
MPRIVSGNQFVGVRGRQIHEETLIANELIDSRKKSGKSGLFFKLDIEKAFDNVNWNCLERILQCWDFPPKVRGWISGLVTSPLLSVLVNGESTVFFKMEKGLRQGDPISPFLFMLVMDILSFILGSLKIDGRLTSFRMDEVGLRGEVTHLYMLIIRSSFVMLVKSRC